jgi:DUF4097 and DUF4098 domain-containing protein YvlB
MKTSYMALRRAAGYESMRLRSDIRLSNGSTMHMLLTTTCLTFLMSLAVPVAWAESPSGGVPPGEEIARRVQGPPRPAPAPRPPPAPRPAARGPQVTDQTVREVQLGPKGELDLGNIAGDIVITGGKGSDVRIEIIKTVPAGALGKEEARELLDLVEVDVVERGNRVEVRARYPPRGGRGAPMRRNMHVAVNYQVTAPPGTRIRAHSVSGSITSTGIEGESSYESVSGNIRVVKGGRVATAKSISGEVELVDTVMDSTVQASSASGSITLRRVKARRADISSISGAVVLDQVDAERIDAQTVSGRVQLDGALRRDARYQLRSHSGDVHVAPAGTTGFDLDATTFSGTVRTDLPMTARAGSDGRDRSRALRGVHGDGSAVLEITTFSGTIVITK